MSTSAPRPSISWVGDDRPVCRQETGDGHSLLRIDGALLSGMTFTVYPPNELRLAYSIPYFFGYMVVAIISVSPGDDAKIEVPLNLSKGSGDIAPIEMLKRIEGHLYSPVS